MKVLLRTLSAMCDIGAWRIARRDAPPITTYLRTAETSGKRMGTMVSPLNGCSALLSLASFGALWGSLATRDRQLPGTTFYALRPCGVKPRLLLTTSAPHNYSHHSRLSKPSDSRAGSGTYVGLSHRSSCVSVTKLSIP
jgi:hypothetical protein